VEMKEKKDRVEDALYATKAALDQGIVPGGGMALVMCSYRLLKEAITENSDQQIGVSIVYKSLVAPFRKIMQNAGIEDYHSMLSEIRDLRVEHEKKHPEDPMFLWYGYNVKLGNFVNMYKEGIIDPTKVTRTAIENAASVAGTILTTESVIFSVGEKKKEEIDYSQFMQ